MVSASFCLRATSARSTGRWAFNGSSEKWRQSHRWTRGWLFYWGCCVGLVQLLATRGAAPTPVSLSAIVHIINGFIELAQPLAVATSCDRNSFKMSSHLWDISPLLQVHCKGLIKYLDRKYLHYRRIYLWNYVLLQFESSVDCAIGSAAE